MALNTWWDGQPNQRYWMEVATTGRMGEMLIAPKFAGASWSYELVSHVRPGDRVLHWQSDRGAGRGIVGWSVVTSHPEISPGYRWKPRGNSGRRLPAERVTDGWMVTLGGFNPFPRPLTAEALQRARQNVLDVFDALDEYGTPLYFPFYLYGGSQLRAQQGYLTKFPSELFDVFQTLRDAQFPSDGGIPGAGGDDDLREDDIGPGKRAPRGRTTRVQDPVLRSAIENHAVDAAIEYYGGLGGSDFVKLGKPYDIRLMLNGVERHAEVKGSSVVIDTVELTINEVTHAHAFGETDLVVVDGIGWRRDADGSVETYGGRLRIWKGWKPDWSDLAPRRFAYSLPAGA